jgi:hypothetical protein
VPRDDNDRRHPQRLTTSFVASLFLHALAAFLLFSLATSSSEQASSESVQGAQIVTVTSQAVPKTVAVAAPHAAPPVPHSRTAPQQAAAQPRSAPPHPRIHHELSKFAPTAPPNPTPAPEASAAPNPQPTQPEIALTPLPIVAAVPTSVPARVVAATIHAPPTAPPTQAPTAAPTARPIPKIEQPKAPEATFAPLIARATPQAVVTPGLTAQVQIRKPAPGVPSPGPTRLPQPSVSHGGAASPGPKTVGSPGPKGIAPVKSSAPAKPIQTVPSTPRPAAAQGKPSSKASRNLNQRLRNILPTPGPYVIATPRMYKADVSSLRPVEPTPPPAVLALTKYIYTENVGGNWKIWPLGSAPEERTIKMYVTSVRHVAGVTMCTGWVVRQPIAGKDPWIVEPDQTFPCGGHLVPYTPPAPLRRRELCLANLVPGERLTMPKARPASGEYYPQLAS